MLDHRQLPRGEDIDGETDPATQRLAHHSSMLNMFERSILFQGVFCFVICASYFRFSPHVNILNHSESPCYGIVVVVGRRFRLSKYWYVVVS